MKEPLITVVIPVYNVAAFIDQTIASVLRQTLTDFECLVIDDCSTDNTVEIIESYHDPRIKVIKKEKNSGYTESLNLGIKIANAKYIARMDGDDMIDRYRFEKQIDFLEKNPAVGVCGSNYVLYPENTYKILSEGHQDILTSLLFECEVAHPSVMIRKSILEKEDIYDSDKEPAEDYNLWVKLVLKTEFHNIQEPLLFYRVHINQVSRTRKVKQMEGAFKARYFLWNYFLKSTQMGFDLFRDVFSDNYTSSFFRLKEQLEHIEAIEQEMAEHYELNSAILKKRIDDLKRFKIRGYYFKNPSLHFSQIPSVLFEYHKYFSFLDFIKIVYKSFKYDRANSNNIHI